MFIVLPIRMLSIQFGAHFDASTAALRALLEVNQSLPTVIRSPEERSRQLLPDFKDALSWWNKATIENQPYLVPDKNKTLIPINCYPRLVSFDVNQQIDKFVSTTEKLGMEFVAKIVPSDVA